MEKRRLAKANAFWPTAVVLSVRFKNLCISHVGILSWGNLIYPNSYIDFSVVPKYLAAGRCKPVLLV